MPAAFTQENGSLEICQKKQLHVLLTINKERGHPNNVEYTEALKGKLIDVVRQALAGMEPVGIGLGVGYSPVGANRRELRVADDGKSSIVLGRNPYGATDREVLVMKVAKADGTPLAVAFDYATHGTSLGRATTPSVATCRAWRSSLSRRFSAPVSSRRHSSGPRAISIRGTECFRRSTRSPAGFPSRFCWGRSWARRSCTYIEASSRPVRPTRLERTSRRCNCPANRKRMPRLRRAGAAAFNITVARLGDVAFVGLGGEVLTEIGMAIKAALALPAHVCHHPLQRRRGLSGPQGRPRAAGLRGHVQLLRPTGGRRRHPRSDPNAT